MRNYSIKVSILLFVLVSIFLGYAKISGFIGRNGDSSVSSVIEVNGNSARKDEPILENKRQQLTRLSDALSKELSKAQSRESFETLMKNFLESNSSIISAVYFASVSGEFYVFPKQTLPKDYDARTRPWYKSALEGGVYLSEFFADAASNRKLIAVARAVYKDNAAVGVLGMDCFVD